MWEIKGGHVEGVGVRKENRRNGVITFQVQNNEKIISVSIHL